MLWETSNLDSEEGIRFRGKTIPECQQILPTFAGPAGSANGEPLLEGLFWLLLTGEVPTKEQCDMLTTDLHKRAAELPPHVIELLATLPKDMHPMTQLTIGLNAAQTNSVFAKKYAEHTLEDVLNVVAQLPEIAAQIYRNVYFDGVVTKDTTLDYSGNFCRMLGMNDPAFDELMRLYLCIHTDHEGGNASAHTTHLVGSTLSDPYLSYAAGLNALAGPLHGLANQEVLSWIQDLSAKFEKEGKEVNKETITEFAWETLNAKKVIPGFGHAVLRKTDPRYTCQRDFALKHLPDDKLFKIVSTIFEVMPNILLEHGKTKNP
jgi:citrate synthase